MSRRRWIVLLGPPILAAALAAPGLARESASPPGALAPLPARSIASCRPAHAGPLDGPLAPVPGTWWRTEPLLDGDGSLDGWTLQVGGPGTPASELRIPAASTVTGPRDGLVVVASEGPADDRGSTVRIVDAATGCATEIHVPDGIARRAVADPSRAGVLVQLLEPGTRRDRGVWRIDTDGHIAGRVLEPLPDVMRTAAGMDRVWATDLRVDPDGERLAVQSCHPDACLTRVVDLASGEVEDFTGEDQGPLIGFAGRELVTWAACHGFPCPVVAWHSGGPPERILAVEASGAALSGDGRQLLVSRSGSDGARDLETVDVQTGAARAIGPGELDAVPLSGAAGMPAGMESPGASIAFGHAGRIPTPRALDDGAPDSLPPHREVQP